MTETPAARQSRVARQQPSSSALGRGSSRAVHGSTRSRSARGAEKGRPGARHRARPRSGRAQVEGAPEAQGGLAPRAVGVAEGGALDKYANNPPARWDRRRSRMRARRVLWDVSTLERVRDCGRVSVIPGGGVGLVVSDGPVGERVAGYRGLASCGSVWACPRCSAIINQHRAEELRGALDSWGRQGGTAALLTLTIRHHRGQRLRDLWDGVVGSWSRLTAGRPWKDFKSRAGVAGAIRVVEVTHGASGWHVHLHVLLLLEGAGDSVGAHMVALSARPAVMAAWRRIVARAGFDAVAEAQDLRPVNLSDGHCALGGYFVKAGWDAAAEIACGASKTARSSNLTPMAILRRFAQDGDADDLERWHEWEAASRGRQQMTWTRGLRGRLRLLAHHADEVLAAHADDGAEQTDEEIACSQNQANQPILILDAQAWRRIRDTDLLWRLLEIAEHEAGRPLRSAMTA